MLRADSGPPASGVLYLHGFNSGEASPKAALMRAACAALALPCATPSLPHRPLAAFELAESRLAGLGPEPLVVGSSMGGFLAACLAERHGLRGALINPAVRPARLVDEWIGVAFVNDYTGERFTVGREHREELEMLTPGTVTPERYLLLLGTADETLPPVDAFGLFAGARTILHPRGDHAFMAMVDHLPAILAHGGHCLAHGRITQQDIDDA